MGDTGSLISRGLPSNLGSGVRLPEAQVNPWSWRGSMRSRCWLCLLGVLFAVSCSDSTGVDLGAVRLSPTVSGPDATLTGLTVTVDGAKSYPLGGGEPLTIPLDMGHHTLTFSGLAANCHLIGPESVGVGVNTGETTELAVQVGCTALTGVVEVRASTTGLDLDPDGYDIVLDGGAAQGIPTNGAVWFPALAEGTHTVALSGAAENCALAVAAPAEVAVKIGGEVRDTARLTIAISCTAVSGVVVVQATTQGPDPDDDGYGVRLDDNLDIFLAPDGLVGIAPVTAGSHSVSVSGLAPNCVQLEANPQVVTIAVGGLVRDTAHVAVHVTCTATTGAIRVGAMVTGDTLDLAYSVSVDGQGAVPFSVSAVIVLGRVAAGTHTVTLSDVAGNCTVQSPNPAMVSVTVGDTSDVAFQVACVVPDRTGADIILTTGGTSVPASYHLTIDDDCYYYYSCNTLFSADVPANGTVEVDLPPGSYLYYLGGVSANCFGSPSGYFSVAAYQVTVVPVNLNCNPVGSVQLSVPTSGLDLDYGFQVLLDGSYLGWINAGATQTFLAPSGNHVIGLGDIAGNCAVTGPNPVSVTVTEGSTTALSMAVNCQALPMLRTTVTTGGTNIPPSFLVGVDADWYYGYLYWGNVPANGSTSFKVSPGAHTVTLDQVPFNCTVDSGNNLAVNVPSGTTTDVAFAVTCH